MKNTLETGISSKIKRKMTNAESAVSVSAMIGDNMIIAFEFSALGISLIMISDLLPSAAKFSLGHLFSYRLHLKDYPLKGHEFVHIDLKFHPNLGR